MSDTGQGSGTEPATPAAKPSGWRRTGRIVFIVVFVLSLGLNVFALGWLGARWWIMGSGWHDHFDDVHPLLEETWDQHSDAVDVVRIEAADALDAVADALVAEPFQQEVFDSAVGRLSAAGQSIMEIGGFAAQDIAAGLDARQRKFVARRARRAAQRMREWEDWDQWPRHRDRRRRHYD